VRGWVTSCEVEPRSATISAIFLVYASASVARSSAFLNRAVAISSIVRVILRMFCTDLRRLTIARALAIGLSRRATVVEDAEPAQTPAPATAGEAAVLGADAGRKRALNSFRTAFRSGRIASGSFLSLASRARTPVL